MSRVQTNLVGRVFNAWTVLAKDPPETIGTSKRWICRCVCGQTKSIRHDILTGGGTTSCGCLRGTNLVGQRFERLIVESLTGTRRRKEKVWQCHCDCGNTIEVVTSDLRQGGIKSCGCLRTDYYKSISKGQGESACHGLVVRIKKQAEYRGIDFCLTEEQCGILFKEKCFYCGDLPKQERKTQNTKTGSFIYNGLDRQDNDKGYSINNVVSCCGKCNRLKGKQSTKEFLEWAKQVLNYRREQ